MGARAAALDRTTGGGGTAGGGRGGAVRLQGLRRAALLLSGLVALALPSPAAAQIAPFGHACAPQAGVRFCPTESDGQRVASWDGVPLDVDVTLPPGGEGPFPTIVMLHGFPGTKANFEGPSNAPRLFRRDNLSYAQRGYAVVTYSSRGFGRSCGVADSRTPDCARGWTHLFDQRYEGRDTQHLLGLLVDAGVAKPGALGVTGESGGSLQSLELAFLRNRIRLPDGRFALWRSPGGRRLSITAAFPTWAGDDIASALAPNGRFLDFTARPEPALPVGVAKAAFIDALFLVADISGFIAPAGADRTADLRNWKEVVDRGEPYGAAARAVTNELRRFHGASAISGTPAPILMQNGWSDDLFGSTEALRVYNRLRDRNSRAQIALQLLDTGHARGGSHPNQERAGNDQALRFFDAWLRRRGTPPAAGSVLAYTQTCPRDASGGTRLVARSWTELHPGAVGMSRPDTQFVSSEGGSLEIGRAFTPNFGTTDACKTIPVSEGESGTATLDRQVPSPLTLAGRPTVAAEFLSAQGAAGQVEARLWDVDLTAGTQTLVTRGAYRVTPGQRGRWRFQLDGNAYRFARGHVVKLELVGRDPDHLRPSNGAFTVSLRALSMELPVRERPSRARGITRPRFAVDPALL